MFSDKALKQLKILPFEPVVIARVPAQVAKMFFRPICLASCVQHYFVRMHHSMITVFQRTIAKMC